MRVKRTDVCSAVFYVFFFVCVYLCFRWFLFAYSNSALPISGLKMLDILRPLASSSHRYLLIMLHCESKSHHCIMKNKESMAAAILRI